MERDRERERKRLAKRNSSFAKVLLYFDLAILRLFRDEISTLR
jgi:hypothetical protein